MEYKIAEQRLMKAQAYGSRGDFEAAMDDLQAIIKDYPQYGDAYYYIAMIYEKRGQLDESAQAYTNAIKYGLRSPKLQGFAHCNLGSIYLKKSIQNEAEKEFEAALKLNPNDEIALCDLGLIRLMNGNPAAALEKFELARKLNSAVFSREGELRQRYLLAKSLIEEKNLLKKPNETYYSKSKGNLDDQLGTLLSPPFDVFISYKSDDANLVRQVADQLLASGIKVWFTEYQVLLENWDEFQQAINEGIRLSTYGVAFTSDKYAESGNCCLEMEELLARLGSDKVLEIKLHDGGETHRKFPELEGSPQLSFNGQIEQILSFISSETKLAVNNPDEITQTVAPQYFEGDCLGKKYQLDFSGWDITKKGKKDFFRLKVNGPEFKLASSPNPIFGNLFAGRETSNASIRNSSDDRRMYDKLRGYAKNYLKILGVKQGGLHLFFHNGLSQMALTYWRRGFWRRKYSIILPVPESQKRAEFVFTFEFTGSFQEYLRQTYKMDKLVHSLQWVE